MDDDRPLFSTFKPLGEDNTASTKPGRDTTRDQPQGAEQPLGHNDTGGRVGQGVAKGPSPPVPPSSHTTGAVSSWAAIEAPRGAQSILGGHPHPSPRPLSPSLQALPGSWPSPPGWSLPEGDLQPELVALRAQTRLWFEQTQARRLGAKGELPAWFHGFISRRETEQLLQDQPPGCFLIRFSESTVGFVLSYRGRDRCRHFVLDQLPDGRYVILGEQSAHAALADLLRHYATAPLAPYHEVLTVPCRREGEPRGGSQTPAGSSAVHPPSSKAPAKPLVYSTVAKGVPAARQVAAAPLLPAEPSTEGGSSREAPNVPPPLPAKASSLGAAQGSHSPAGGGAAPKGPSAQVPEAAPPTPPPPPPPADAKYQQLMCFHTYAEPHEGIAPRPPARKGLQEPIPFYAMGRGSSPGTSHEENIYSEVALAQQDLPAPLPGGSRGGFSTLPPKPRAHRWLFRSVSSQASKRRQVLAAPSTIGKGTTNPRLELPDAGRSRGTSAAKQPLAAAGQKDPENIYEQVSGHRL
ncbi:SH2 domain-containing protein 2A isoform X2 [Falco rusticolus]|uniref:SH2 domain-containing protein 2A isoform X2 n=1 Tax=Falco rusticolus TaxID=120794 RepID=UPI00188693DF|nr:SH2 domain-containing protein 2A isoform X2 [Falco rusticolus]